MWKVIINTIDRQPDGRYSLNVVYTDDTSKISDNVLAQFNTIDDVKRFFQVRIKEIENRDNVIKGLSPGEFDTTIIPPILDPDEQQRKDFFLALGKLQRLKQLVDLDVIKIDDKTYTETLTATITLFKPEYF